MEIKFYIFLFEIRKKIGTIINQNNYKGEDL